MFSLDFFLLSIFEVKMIDFFTSMIAFSKFDLVDTLLAMVLFKTYFDYLKTFEIIYF